VVARGVLEGETGQREQLAAWERALTASGLPIAGLDASPPKPRFALGAPLGAAIPGEAELADTWLTQRMPVWRVREALARSLAPGYRLVDVEDVWLGEAPLPGQVVASVYRATFGPGAIGVSRLEAACRDMLAARVLPRERRKGQSVVGYDLRPFLVGLEVEAPSSGLRMTLRHDPERGIGRPEEVLASLGEHLAIALEPASLVRERLVLAAPSPSAAAVTRSGPRGRPRTATATTTRRG
jgi:radical SAM-linked protein